MTADKIIGVMTACIVSAGGTGAVIIGVLKITSGMIADKLSKKYELVLEKELEKYKTQLNKKEYVSKTRFDTEFKIYRELSNSFSNLVKDVSVMYPVGISSVPANEELKNQEEENNYKTARESYVKAQDALASNAAFIPLEKYQGYKEILSIAYKQLRIFERRYIVNIGFKKQDDMEAYDLTETINLKWDEHNNNIRDYLATLDVYD